MTTVHILRDASGPDGVFGHLTLSTGPLVLQTLEEQELGNASSISCIPDGTYVLEKTVHHKDGVVCYEVTHVPGRSHILLHVGNSEEDTEGCILVGLTRGTKSVLDEDTGQINPAKAAVLQSKVAFQQFMAAMGGVQTATLVIEWVPGLP